MESVLHAVPIPFVVIVLVLFVYVRSFLDRKKLRTHGLPLPPGPKGWPVIGNMFDMQASQPWLAYRDLAVEYGASLDVRDPRVLC